MTAPTNLPGWGKATGVWGVAALTRALKTFVQSFVGAISGTALFTSVDWKVVVSAAGIAALASFAQSLDGLPEVPTGAAPLQGPPLPQQEATPPARARAPRPAPPVPEEPTEDFTPEPAWPVDLGDDARGRHRT